jgi:hypothetical protein
MRKVYMNVMVRVIVEMEEGVEVEDVVNEFDYNFISTVDNADVVDTEILDFEVIDSK